MGSSGLPAVDRHTFPCRRHREGRVSSVDDLDLNVNHVTGRHKPHKGIPSCLSVRLPVDSSIYWVVTTTTTRVSIDPSSLVLSLMTIQLDRYQCYYPSINPFSYHGYQVIDLRRDMQVGGLPRFRLVSHLSRSLFERCPPICICISVFKIGPWLTNFACRAMG